MLPLEIIEQYYPNASEDELKDIQEVVYLLTCAVMQEFYRSTWMGGFEEIEQEEKGGSKASSIPLWMIGYRISILQNSATFWS